MWGRGNLALNVAATFMGRFSPSPPAGEGRVGANSPDESGNYTTNIFLTMNQITRPATKKGAVSQCHGLAYR